jgi:hypothetical protein
MYPNTVLAGWQLALMIIVPLASMTVWLAAIFLAARPSSGRAREASTTIDLPARDVQERQDKLAA